MIDSHGRVRLVDFGIAKAIQVETQPDARSSDQTMIGTPGYAPPEQYKGQVTPLSDVYSLGATLHHILTRQDPRGEPPFTFDRRPIKEFDPEVPDTLIAIIDKAVQRDPADRWQSAAEMKAALERMRYGPVQEDLFAEVDVVEEPAAVNTVEPRWTFVTKGEIRVTPTSYNNLVYFGSDDTNIWAIRLENGELAWKYPTGGPVAVSPVVDEENKQVLFGTEDCMFHAVDYYTGRENWSFKTRDRIRSTAAVAHRHVFFGSDDGQMYALVANNGRLVWDYLVGSEIQSRPFVTNELVIFGCISGDVMALELSGSTKWNLRTKGKVMAAPVVDMETNVCYVGSFDRHLYAVDVKTGFKQWQFKSNGLIVAGAAVGPALVYFGASDGALYAVTKESGKRRWEFQTEKAIVSAPVLHGDAVYVSSNDGCLYCVDAVSGQLRWKFKTNDTITGSPYVVENTILVGSLDKTLYALPLK
jgi:outer membrane protein assembly factor BamB